MSTDPYVETVKQKYDQRSAKGINRYGTDLTREDLSYDDWLTHLQEELMDGSLYIERLKSFREEIHGKPGDTVRIMTYGQDFQELQADIYKNAVEHGFWEPEKSMGENIALMHSELSEALEEYRKGTPLLYGEIPSIVAYDSHKQIPSGVKPEGIASEMADVIIRIMDWAEHEQVDLWNVIVAKHEYNKTREFRHGGKKL